MKKFIPISILFLSILGCSNNEPDTSPFYDIKSTQIAPLYDLVNAVLVYQSINDSLPQSFNSLKSLTTNDWINAGRIQTMTRDTIIVGNIDMFSGNESSISKTQSGVTINYFINDSTFYYTDYEEALYSKDFDTQFFVSFYVTLMFKKGIGSIDISFTEKSAKIYIDTLEGFMWPGYGSIGDSKLINIKDKSFTYDLSEPVFLE